MYFMKAVKVWMSTATVAEQEALAKEVGSSRGYLYQLAGGFRNASADLAAKIESATLQMAKKSKGRLPVVFRTDLSTACSQCHFARKCIGAKADFELVGGE